MRTDQLLIDDIERHLPKLAAEVSACDGLWSPHEGPAGALVLRAHGLTPEDPRATKVLREMVADCCLRRVAAEPPPALKQATGTLLSRGIWFERLSSLNFWLQMVGAFLGLYGQVLINDKNAWGFVAWVGSNMALIWLQSRTRLMVLVGLHSIYLVLSLYGLYRWMH